MGEYIEHPFSNQDKILQACDNPYQVVAYANGCGWQYNLTRKRIYENLIWKLGLYKICSIRPYKNAEEFLSQYGDTGFLVKLRNEAYGNVYKVIIEFDDNGVSLEEGGKIVHISYDQLLREYRTVDNHRCGILE